MNLEARRDIAWWQRFLPTWNGRAIIPDPYWSRSPDLALFTDASGTLGYCIYYSGHWIADTWPPPLQGRSIQWKELYPIALACLLWGHSWSGKKILFHSNNEAVVDIWASGTSQDPDIIHLAHSIFFSGATHHFTILVLHIGGTDYSIADSIWFADGAVPSAHPSCGPNANTYPSISQYPLECRLAFLQSSHC